MALKKKSRKDTLPNPLIVEYEKRNKRNTIAYSLQPVSNANLKWRDLPSVERHAYCEKLSKLQERSFGVPRERALLIDNEIYPEWVLEFFSTLYIDKDVDRNNLMKLEVDDKQFDHKDYWTRVSKPTLTNHREVLVKEPLMRIVHKVIVGSLVHRELRRIACFLGYCVDDEIKKCSELIDCEYWISKMLADELDVENTCLKKETEMPTQAEEGSSEPRQEH
ncbi:hypothetical protein Tco_1415576 [Tanacetum coccineum]